MSDTRVTHAPARPAQFVLRTDKSSNAAEFYPALFGWTLEDDATYVLGSQQVASTQSGSGGWLPYLTVTDLDEAARRAAAAGAPTVSAPAELGLKTGRGLVITAPGGAQLGLWQAGSGAGVEVMNVPGAVVWIEEKTHHQAADTAFLSTLFGFELLGGEGPGAVRVLKGEGPLFGGVMQFDDRWAPDEAPHWLLYFEVSDVEACVTRAVEVGGSVWFAPFDTPLGLMAYLRDPEGNPFAVVAVSAQGRGMTGGAA